MLISLMYMNLRSPWLPTVVHILYLQINGGRCLTTVKAHPSLLYHILGGGAGTKMQLLHSVDRAGLGSAVTEAGKSRKCWSHLNMPQSQIHFLPVNWGWTHQTLVTMFRWSCRDTRNRIYLDVSLRSSVPRTKERHGRRLHVQLIDVRMEDFVHESDRGWYEGVSVRELDRYLPHAARKRRWVNSAYRLEYPRRHQGYLVYFLLVRWKGQWTFACCCPQEWHRNPILTYLQVYRSVRCR